jgi:hypothetical protein
MKGKGGERMESAEEEGGRRRKIRREGVGGGKGFLLEGGWGDV